MSIGNIDCVSQPIKDLSVKSGWWVDSMSNACGKVGYSTGGDLYNINNCPYGITKVDYSDGLYVGSVRFTCDDDSTQGPFGYAKDKGDGPINTFSCPPGKYLSKISAVSDTGGFKHPNFECNASKPVTLYTAPVLSSPTVAIPLTSSTPFSPLFLPPQPATLNTTTTQSIAPTSSSTISPIIISPPDPLLGNIPTELNTNPASPGAISQPPLDNTSISNYIPYIIGGVVIGFLILFIIYKKVFPKQSL